MNNKIKMFSIFALIILLSATTLFACGKNDIKAENLKLEVVEGLFGGTQQKQLEFSFKLNKDLNLDEAKNNVKISYFTIVDNKEVAITNTSTNQALVKDKGWAGFLYNDGNKYVKGTVGASDYNEEYPNTLKAGTVYVTALRNGMASDNTSMEYHQINFNNAYKFKVKINVELNGKSNVFEKTFDYQP